MPFIRSNVDQLIIIYVVNIPLAINSWGLNIKQEIIMNIKSLLLGSAAAMVAVSGAQAADAVVVEAEPVDYVRVCDAYGSGFFFIPGTETCIRFSGYVRTQFTKLNVDNDTQPTLNEYENTRWTTRTRFDIDTRNETDWGTLRSLIRLQSNNAADDGAGSNNPARIPLTQVVDQTSRLTKPLLQSLAYVLVSVVHYSMPTSQPA